MPLIQASFELDRGKGSKAIETLERSAFDLVAGSIRNSRNTDRSSQISRWGRWLTWALFEPMPRARNIESSRTAYEAFLSLWKDADPDIPIVKEAKAEYAKLR